MKKKIISLLFALFIGTSLFSNEKAPIDKKKNTEEEIFQ